MRTNENGLPLRRIMVFNCNACGAEDKTDVEGRDANLSGLLALCEKCKIQKPKDYAKPKKGRIIEVNIIDEVIQ